MTGRPVTPEQQAAAVGIIAAERCRDVHPIRSVVCHACRSWGQHVATRLAAAGVLRDPDAHEAVPHCPTCTCGCTCGYGGLHEPENPRCNLNAAIDGAAPTTGHGRDEVTG